MPNTHLPTLMFEAMQQQQQPFESPDQCHQSGLDASPNVVGDAPLTIPGREERVPHEKSINLVRNCKNNYENMLLSNANTTGEIIKAASDFKGAANVSDQGFLDESEDNDQGMYIVSQIRICSCRNLQKKGDA
ncbi:hypothetical protein Patl1_36342 [Pistacia atlantica]|nr:hypothetical protein Patl1_36342 [Pistacia atlantica]